MNIDKETRYRINVEPENEYDDKTIKEETEELAFNFNDIKVEEKANVENKRRIKKGSFIILGVITIALCVAIPLFLMAVKKENIYKENVSLMEKNQYSSACEGFTSLNGYKDSEEKAEDCLNAINQEKYDQALILADSGEYNQAIELMTSLSEENFSNSAAQLENIKKNAYNSAIEKRENADFEEAIELFKVLNGYSDSESQIKETEEKQTEYQYNEAISLLNDGNISEAYNLLKEIETYEPANIELNNNEKFYSVYIEQERNTLREVNIGEIVTFGSYKDEDVTWYVIDKSDSKIMLYSEKILDYQPFYKYDMDEVSADWLLDSDNFLWANSYLRKWLNNDFKIEAFNSWQSEMLCGGDAEDELGDEVSLLSKSEVESYMGFHPEWGKVKKTRYTNNDSSINEYYTRTKEDWVKTYWYISTGAPAYVMTSSSTNSRDAKCISPCIWISLLD